MTASFGLTAKVLPDENVPDKKLEPGHQMLLTKRDHYSRRHYFRGTKPAARSL